MGAVYRRRVRIGGLLLAGLTVVLAPATAGVAAPAAVRSALTSAVAAPTNKAQPAEKIKAASALGIDAGADMLGYNDQDFVFDLWRKAKDDSFVKAAALRAYEDTSPDAAYQFIVAGIFTAVHDDNQAEIVAEQAKALRRSVAVIVGLDPKDTALVEKNDRDFIISVFQHAAAGTHLYTAAKAAFANGATQQDWTVFLTTGAKAAVDADLADAIAKADADQVAKLRAEQLANAKRSLLQLLLLPVTDELVNAPNRQYVLHIHNSVKGAEVTLAAQAALNAPDDQLDRALSDFIFTGGAAANTRDEDAAAAKELAGYRERVTAIRDAGRTGGLEPNLVAAADKALADNTALALQTFLFKGQDDARALDDQWRAPFAHDFNGDRKTDIAAINSAGNLALYLGDGAGKLASGGDMWATDGSWKGFTAIAARDFNGDRKTDIAAIDAVGNLTLYAGDGAGKLASGKPMWATDGSWRTVSAITAGDFNGDGKVDVAAIDAVGNLTLYAGDGAGKLASGKPMWATDGSWRTVTAITAGHFTDDGKIDIAAISSAGNLTVYAGDGTGNLAGGKPMWATDGSWKTVTAIA